jgi:hypothetical protein
MLLCATVLLCVALIGVSGGELRDTTTHQRSAVEFNVAHAYYAVVRLHELHDGVDQTVELRPKLARDQTRVAMLEPHLPRQFQSRQALHRFENEQAAVDPAESDKRIDDERLDALAEAEAADTWAATLFSDSDGTRHPSLHFNVSGRFLHTVTLLAADHPLQPFTLLCAHPDSGWVLLNHSHGAHGFTHDKIAIKLDPPMILDYEGLDRQTPFEFTVVFHPRRLSTFAMPFTLQQLEDRSRNDGDTLRLVPDNATMGVDFVVRWQRDIGQLGVWVRRRPPIPDLVFELWMAVPRKSNDETDDRAAANPAGRRILSEIFTDPSPHGVGFDNILEAAHGFHLDDDLSETFRRSVRFTVVVHFAERPREHYGTFEIADLALVTSKVRNRLDGLVLKPSQVDHHTISAPTTVLPVQVLLRFPHAEGEYLSLEVLQPRPLGDVQVWIRDGDNQTLLLEEDYVVHDFVEHWRRDVRHYGFHRAIPVNKPVAGNRVRIDVLFNAAAAGPIAGVGPTSGDNLLRWLEVHGADVSRVGLAKPPVNPHAIIASPSAALGGRRLVYRASAGAPVALEGHVLARIPPSVVLRSTAAVRVPWVNALLTSTAFDEFTAGHAVAPFLGASSDVRDVNFEVLQLALLVLSRNDPPPGISRFQALYASLHECHSKNRWAPPIMFFADIHPVLAECVPHYAEQLQRQHDFLVALYAHLNATASWLFTHAAPTAASLSDASAARRGKDDQKRSVEAPIPGYRAQLLPDTSQVSFDLFVDHFSSVEGFLLLQQGQENADFASERVLVPLLCFIEHSNAPNSEIVLGAIGSDVVVRARPSTPRTKRLADGEPVTVDWSRIPSVGGSGPRELDAFTAFSLLGTVPQNAADAADMPNGRTLLRDRKVSRDAIMRDLCGDAWRDQPSAKRLECFIRLRAAIELRASQLPLQVPRPDRGSRLYGRGVHLQARVPRLLAACRRTLRQHLDYVERDIAQLQAAIQAAASSDSSDEF